MNDLTIITPAEQFRAKASGLLLDVATMSLHDLVDEFQRLTDVMEEDTNTDPSDRKALGEAGQLASRERKLINGAARARFGIQFDAHDRSNPEDDDGW